MGNSQLETPLIPLRRCEVHGRHAGKRFPSPIVELEGVRLDFGAAARRCE